MITAFKTYRYYMAVKLHFTSDKYDVFANGGRVKGTEEVFNKRNDVYLFHKVATKYKDDKQVIQFFVSNFAYGNPSPIYNLEQANQNYMEWVSRKESITEKFKNDLSKIRLFCEKNDVSLEGLVSSNGSNVPPLLKMYLGNHIMIETISILNDIIGFLPLWRSTESLSMWTADLRKVEKLKNFVKYDANRIKVVYNNFINNLTCEVN